jgi:secreted trypsin-like serine protease
MMAAMRRPAALAVALLALVPVAAGGITSHKRGVKILGGAIAAPGQFPFMVALIDSAAPDDSVLDGFFCGGELIAPRVVLTAGHCVEGSKAKEMDVVVGRTLLSDQSSGQRIDVAKIVQYPTYDSRQVTGDVALLQLAQPAAVTPMPIAHAGDGTAQTPGTRVLAMGWGTTAEGGTPSNELRYVRLTVRSHGYCDAIYGAIHDGQQVCIGSSRAGEDTCQGDSGGPILSTDGTTTRIIATVSYGQGCGHANTPGVYARTSYFASWIDRNAALLNGDVAPPAPPVNPPAVKIGSIACGAVYCNVTLRTSGRAPAGGIVLDYVRHRTSGHKAIDDFVFAKQQSSTTWVAHAPLPYGTLTLYAIPLNAKQTDLDGNGDVQRIQIVAA